MRFSQHRTDVLAVEPQRTTLRTIYQPIVDYKNKNIFGLEALVRSQDGTPPSVLFQQAMESGWALQLDKICIEQAIENWPPYSPRLFVNMLPQTIITLYQTGELANIIAQKDCTVVIEVTETEKQQSVAKLKEALAWAKKKGALVAVDDLLNGYDRLQTVSLITPDFIKLNAPCPSYSLKSYRATIVGIQALAKELGALVIAEKVENRTTFEFLADTGIKLFQGFYFAKPGSPFTDIPVKRQQQP